METRPIQLELFDARPIVPFRLKFGQCADIFDIVHWKKTKMSKKIAALVRYTRAVLDEHFMDEIHRTDLENLRVTLHAVHKQGPKGINHAIGYVKSLFNRCYEWRDDGYVEGQDMRGLILPLKNPASLLRKLTEAPRDRTPTPLEIRKLIKYARQINDYDAADILRAAFWFRMSPGDLLQFSDAHVNEAKFRIEMRRCHTKTRWNPQGELQVVRMTEKMWGFINRRRMMRPAGTTLILNFINWRRRLKKLRLYAMKQGMEDFWTGDFRRAAASHLFEKGWSIAAVADALGNTPGVAKRHYITTEPPFRREMSEDLVRATDGETGD